MFFESVSVIIVNAFFLLSIFLEFRSASGFRRVSSYNGYSEIRHGPAKLRRIVPTDNLIPLPQKALAEYGQEHLNRCDPPCVLSLLGVLLSITPLGSTNCESFSRADAVHREVITVQSYYAGNAPLLCKGHQGCIRKIHWRIGIFCH